MHVAKAKGFNCAQFGCLTFSTEEGHITAMYRSVAFPINKTFSKCVFRFPEELGIGCDRDGTGQEGHGHKKAVVNRFSNAA